MQYLTNHAKCVSLIKEKLPSSDLATFDFLVAKKKATVFYIDSITDKTRLGDLVIKPLSKIKSTIKPLTISQMIYSPSCQISPTIEDGINDILLGSALIIIDGAKQGITVDLLKFSTRAISEPPTSAVIKGPRTGFNETLKTNLALMRRRIKSQNLIIANFTVGKYTKTDVAVLYINSIANDKIVSDIISKIKGIDIDGVVDSSYISKLIVKEDATLFKQVGNTEKPDILTAKLLEGRIGILVDGSPIAITTPYLLFEDFQSSEDYFQNNYKANMQRGIRLIAIFFSLLLPASFVSAELFHLQVIPLNFLLTIVNSIKGIPLSPSIEMLFTLLIFETLNEASVRMPKYVGMALSIVGALVLGDTAVRAGIVSTPTIMIMALSGICLYTVPELVDTLSFLRLLYLLVGGTFGAYGMILLTCFLMIYLVDLTNFAVPILSPFAPLVKDDLKDTLFMTNLPNMKTRPLSLKPKNKRRLKVNE